MQTTVSPETVCWDDVKREYPVPYVFQHGRRSKSGSERLVRVEYYANFDKENFVGWSEPTRSLWHDSPIMCLSGIHPRAWWSYFPHGMLDLQINRVFAGQADLSDESHFTIDYELHGQRNTVDGWLMPDNTVKLQQRLGLLKP